MATIKNPPPYKAKNVPHFHRSMLFEHTKKDSFCFSLSQIMIVFNEISRLNSLFGPVSNGHNTVRKNITNIHKISNKIMRRFDGGETLFFLHHFILVKR